MNNIGSLQENERLFRRGRQSSFNRIGLILTCFILVMTTTTRNAVNAGDASTPTSSPAPPSVKPTILSTSVKTSTSASISVSTSSSSSSTNTNKPQKSHKKYVVVSDKVLSPQTWSSWTPMPDENITTELLLLAPTPSIVPLTVAEQGKRTANTANIFEQQKKQEIQSQIAKDKLKYHYATKPQSSSSSGSGSGGDKWSQMMESLRKQAFSYTQMLLDNFLSGLESTKPSKSKSKKQQPKKQGKSILPDQMTSSSINSPVVPLSTVPFLPVSYTYGVPVAQPAPVQSSAPAPAPINSFTPTSPWPAYASTAFNLYNTYSSFGGDSRSVVNWLARLIGVAGKTLGEFLREYQVHVLYDLIFTFFKWIFFLYAGLLIP